MASSPAKKESTTISMVVGSWQLGQWEQFSPVHSIKGYPWRLRIKFNDFQLRFNSNAEYSVSLMCGKSRESELWKCTVNGSFYYYEPSMASDAHAPFHETYCSWENDGQEKTIFSPFSNGFEYGATLLVEISIVEDGESWRLRPTLNFNTIPNRIIVIGKGEKEFGVNMEFLGSQSPYFDVLFFGNFMEKNMDKISIRDVEYEEFCNIIKMVTGSSEALLTDMNVLRVLELADRFQLKIVEDRAISYFLSTSSFSIAQKLLVSQDMNNPLLKDLCLKSCVGTDGKRKLMQVKRAPEFADFSDALKAEILERLHN